VAVVDSQGLRFVEGSPCGSWFASSRTIPVTRTGVETPPRVGNTDFHPSRGLRGATPRLQTRQPSSPNGHQPEWVLSFDDAPLRPPHLQLYDRSRAETPATKDAVVFWLLQWTRGVCKRLRRVPYRGQDPRSCLHLRAVPCRAKDITRAGLFASRVDAKTSQLLIFWLLNIKSESERKKKQGIKKKRKYYIVS